MKDGLANRDKHFSLSPEAIQKYVSREANQLKQNIIDEVRNRMVSVKVDGITRLDRSFIGINIQYMKNSHVVFGRH